MSLFSGTGKENQDEGNEIAREDYLNGYDDDDDGLDNLYSAVT